MRQQQNWLLNTSMCNVVSRVTRAGLNNTEVLFFLFSAGTHRLWGSATHPPVHLVAGTLQRWLSCRSTKLTTHLHIMPRFRITKARTLLPHTPLCLHRGQFCLCLSIVGALLRLNMFYFPFFRFILKHTMFLKVVLHSLSDKIPKI
jgi:hypothetical protein